MCSCFVHIGLIATCSLDITVPTDCYCIYTAHAHHEEVAPHSIPITLPTSLSLLSVAGVWLRQDNSRHTSNKKHVFIANLERETVTNAQSREE